MEDVARIIDKMLFFIMTGKDKRGTSNLRMPNDLSLNIVEVFEFLHRDNLRWRGIDSLGP